MKELINTPSHHRLLEDETGRLRLEVECGTTAVFLLTIELNEEERRGFGEAGAESIRGLATRIQDNPDDYLNRRIS